MYSNLLIIERMRLRLKSLMKALKIAMELIPTLDFRSSSLKLLGLHTAYLALIIRVVNFSWQSLLYDDAIKLWLSMKINLIVPFQLVLATFPLIESIF
jgi:hypothetical protein